MKCDERIESTYNFTITLKVTPTATTASSIQKAHATVLDQSPQAGTQTNTHISMRVANPIGIVPRNREFVGSFHMTVHIPG